MKTALTIFCTGVAIAGAVTLVSARSPHREEAVAQPKPVADASTAYAQADDDTVSTTVPITIFAPRYTSSPRIIHVARPDARDEARDDNAGSSTTEIDNDYVPPPRPPMVRRIKRAPRADVPQSPGTGLTAKPNDGPSPIYPTPRFSKSTAAVPRDPPIDTPPPPAADTPPSPPIGYTPPSDLPPEQK